MLFKSFFSVATLALLVLGEDATKNGTEELKLTIIEKKMLLIFNPHKVNKDVASVTVNMVWTQADRLGWFGFGFSNEGRMNDAQMYTCAPPPQPKNFTGDKDAVILSSWKGSGHLLKGSDALTDYQRGGVVHRPGMKAFSCVFHLELPRNTKKLIWSALEDPSKRPKDAKEIPSPHTDLRGAVETDEFIKMQDQQNVEAAEEKAKKKNSASSVQCGLLFAVMAFLML